MSQLCVFCGEPSGSIKSHVIPRWIYAAARAHTGAVLRVIGDPDRPSYKSPKGTYETGLCCARCEQRSSSFERAARDVFVTTADSWTTELNGIKGLPAWSLSGVNAADLAFFFFQLLGKAHFTTAPEYQGVRLGPFADQFRHAIASWDTQTIPDWFAVNLIRFLPSKLVPGSEFIVSTPVRGRYGGCNAYFLQFAGFAAFIKVDSKPFDPIIKKFQLGAQGSRIWALTMDFDTWPPGLPAAVAMATVSHRVQERLSRRPQ